MPNPHKLYIVPAWKPGDFVRIKSKIMAGRIYMDLPGTFLWFVETAPGDFVRVHAGDMVLLDAETEAALKHFLPPDMRDPAKAIFTCDRPLCHACVAKSFPIHFHGKVKYWDSRDYCRDCIEQGLMHGNRIQDGMQRPANLFTLEEGRALQRRRLFQPVRVPTVLDQARARIAELEAKLKEASAPSELTADDVIDGFSESGAWDRLFDTVKDKTTGEQLEAFWRAGFADGRDR